MTLLRSVVIFLPAFKKSTRFQDDLVRKLSGVELVQRAITKSIGFCQSKIQIHLLTDSDEVRIIGHRAGISVYCVPGASWSVDGVSRDMLGYIESVQNSKTISVILSPYCPLIELETIHNAIKDLLVSDNHVLIPVFPQTSLFSDANIKTIENVLFGSSQESYLAQSTAFTIFRPGVLIQNLNADVSVLPWIVGEDVFEIRSLQDWWVCEKLIERRRIVFQVIGNNQVGMGHVYRALSLAQEFTDHEVWFVTDPDNGLAIQELDNCQYKIGVYKRLDIIRSIISLEPDLVVLDILDSEVTEVQELKRQNIPVISFEDLGSGSRCTDLTINEIYDEPQLPGENFLWGWKYFFVRDEFSNAQPNTYTDDVESVLLVFGGTDQHDLTRKILFSILEVCSCNKIFIRIVTGPGYRGYEELSKEVHDLDGVSITHATGVISEIMEKSSIAITSNGRTVYELAHMSIPSIVISQHKRENTHKFATPNNGFIPVGIYRTGVTEGRVVKELTQLIHDKEYRRWLFKNADGHSFAGAKAKVVNRMLKFLA